MKYAPAQPWSIFCKENLLKSAARLGIWWRCYLILWGEDQYLVGAQSTSDLRGENLSVVLLLLAQNTLPRASGTSLSPKFYYGISVMLPRTMWPVLLISFTLVVTEGQVLVSPEFRGFSQCVGRLQVFKVMMMKAILNYKRLCPCVCPSVM